MHRRRTQFAPTSPRPTITHALTVVPCKIHARLALAYTQMWCHKTAKGLLALLPLISTNPTTTLRPPIPTKTAFELLPNMPGTNFPLITHIICPHSKTPTTIAASNKTWSIPYSIAPQMRIPPKFHSNHLKTTPAIANPYRRDSRECVAIAAYLSIVAISFAKTAHASNAMPTPSTPQPSKG